MWNVRTGIDMRPLVQYVSHCTDFHETSGQLVFPFTEFYCDRKVYGEYYLLNYLLTYLLHGVESFLRS